MGSMAIDAATVLLGPDRRRDHLDLCGVAGAASVPRRLPVVKGVATGTALVLAGRGGYPALVCRRRVATRAGCVRCAGSRMRLVTGLAAAVLYRGPVEPRLHRVAARARVPSGRLGLLATVTGMAQLTGRLPVNAVGTEGDGGAVAGAPPLRLVMASSAALVQGDGALSLLGKGMAADTGPGLAHRAHAGEMCLDVFVAALAAVGSRHLVVLAGAMAPEAAAGGVAVCAVPLTGGNEAPAIIFHPIVAANADGIVQSSMARHADPAHELRPPQPHRHGVDVALATAEHGVLLTRRRVHGDVDVAAILAEPFCSSLLLKGPRREPGRREQRAGQGHSHDRRAAPPRAPRHARSGSASPRPPHESSSRSSSPSQVPAPPLCSKLAAHGQRLSNAATSCAVSKYSAPMGRLPNPHVASCVPSERPRNLTSPETRTRNGA